MYIIVVKKCSYVFTYIYLNVNIDNTTTVIKQLCGEQINRKITLKVYIGNQTAIKKIKKKPNLNKTRLIR